MISQLIMDKFKLLPLHLTISFVVLGSLLECFNIYDYLIDTFQAGALTIISNFGHSLTHSAVEGAMEQGITGLFTSVFNSCASGISFTVIIAFFVALIFKPRG